MKFSIWFHQRVLDKMIRLQWLCQDVKMLNRFAYSLQQANALRLEKQIARRHKAGIPVIECSVEWSSQ